MTTNRMKGSLADDSRGQIRKIQLAEGREVTRALQSKYDSWAARYLTATQDFIGAVKEILSDAGLASGNVTARVKSFHSLWQKILRHEVDGDYVYPGPWHNIRDITSVYVTAYHSTEIPAVMDALGDSLTVLRTVDKTAETQVSGRLEYGSQRLICKVSTAAPSELVLHADMQLEVQLRAMLQYAWTEFEHDIRCKTPEGATDPRIGRAFALAAGLIELTDQWFDQVAATLGESTPGNSAQGEDEKSSVSAKTIVDDIVVTEETLPGVLTMLSPNAPHSKSEHYSWAEELLECSGIRIVGQLRELLNPQYLSVMSKAMKYRLNPGHVRAIDDLLLAAHGEEHIRTIADTSHNPKHRSARLRARLQQLVEAGMLMSGVPEDD